MKTEIKVLVAEWLVTVLHEDDNEMVKTIRKTKTVIFKEVYGVLSPWTLTKTSRTVGDGCKVGVVIRHTTKHSWVDIYFHPRIHCLIIFTTVA